MALQNESSSSKSLGIIIPLTFELSDLNACENFAELCRNFIPNSIVIIRPVKNDKYLEPTPKFVACAKNFNAQGGKILCWLDTQCGGVPLESVTAHGKTCFDNLETKEGVKLAGFMVNAVSPNLDKMNYYTTLSTSLRAHGENFLIFGKANETSSEFLLKEPKIFDCFLFEFGYNEWKTGKFPVEWKTAPKDSVGALVYSCDAVKQVGHALICGRERNIQFIGLSSNYYSDFCWNSLHENWKGLVGYLKRIRAIDDEKFRASKPKAKTNAAEQTESPTVPGQKKQATEQEKYHLLPFNRVQLGLLDFLRPDWSRLEQNAMIMKADEAVFDYYQLNQDMNVRVDEVVTSMRHLMDIPRNAKMEDAATKVVNAWKYLHSHDIPYRITKKPSKKNGMNFPYPDWTCIAKDREGTAVKCDVIVYDWVMENGDFENLSAKAIQKQLKKQGDSNLPFYSQLVLDVWEEVWRNLHFTGQVEEKRDSKRMSIIT